MADYRRAAHALPFLYPKLGLYLKNGSRASVAPVEMRYKNPENLYLITPG